MIRSALIALGLCAGAADANVFASSPPALEIRDDTVLVSRADVRVQVGDEHEDDTDVATDEDASEHLGLAVSRSFVVLEGEDGAHKLIAAGCFAPLQYALVLSDVKTTWGPAANGADPSTDFCP